MKNITKYIFTKTKLSPFPDPLLKIDFGLYNFYLSYLSVFDYYYYRYVYSMLFHHMGWKVVGVITQASHELPDYHHALKEQLLNKGISLYIRKYQSSTKGILEVRKECYISLNVYNYLLVSGKSHEL